MHPPARLEYTRVALKHKVNKATLMPLPANRHKTSGQPISEELHSGGYAKHKEDKVTALQQHTQLVVGRVLLVASNPTCRP